MNLLLLVALSMAAGAIITFMIGMLRRPRVERKWRQRHELYIQSDLDVSRPIARLRQRRLE